MNKYIQKNERIRRAKRSVFRQKMFSLVLVMVVLFGIFAFSNVSGKPEHPTKKITVCSGDTLWSIAKGIDSNANVREVIFKISKLNNLKTDTLQPGQELVIPTY